jgi:hypothetical protein
MANGTLKVSNIQTSSGSGTITIGQSGETITIPSGATVSGAGANTPSFFARLSADQTLSDNTYTKIVFNTEVYDSDTAYDTSTGRYTIPSGEGGKYSISYQLLLYDANAQLTGGRASLYKNGSSLEEQILDMEGSGDKYFYNSTMGTNIILDLSASDYIEVYGRGNTLDSGTFVIDGDTNGFYSFFQAYKLIGV